MPTIRGQGQVPASRVGAPSDTNTCHTRPFDVALGDKRPCERVERDRHAKLAVDDRLVVVVGSLDTVSGITDGGEKRSRTPS